MRAPRLDLRTRTAVLVLLSGTAALPAGAATAWAGSTADGASQHVLVSTVPGATAAVADAVRRAGGAVTAELPLIDGFSARLSPAAVQQLRTRPGVRAVTPDAPVRLASVDPALGYDPVTDFGSLYDVTRVARVHDAWRAGITGKGVDVALIDSGVSPVDGLTSGNVVTGPDLSFESQDLTTGGRDTFGHGTHMASIIAGRDRAGTPASYTDPTRFTGVAPDARVLSVKVAANDGATDVSQVIAGIDWVTQHAHDPGVNVRVINLSFGTDSVQDYRVDPLVLAAEAAWRRGIVVVVAGGNEGLDTPLLSDPAMSPNVLAVGAEDPQGTLMVNDDVVPEFANKGTAARHVDLVAPAVHVLGLTVPGSTIDTANPAGKVGTRFLRGSGTSQATAVTSGAVALYLQRYPAATPDQVKRAFMQSANPFPGARELRRGSGALDVKAALAVAPSGASAAGPFGTGTGTLEGSRGSAHVADGGVDLVGERDIFGLPFSGARWAPLSLAGRAWTGGSWNGSTWTGPGWSGSTWLPTTWTGSSWTGRTWTGRTWSGRTWTGAGWSAGTWTGFGWSASDWQGRTWTGRTWTGNAWAGDTWR